MDVEQLAPIHNLEKLRLQYFSFTYQFNCHSNTKVNNELLDNYKNLPKISKSITNPCSSWSIFGLSASVDCYMKLLSGLFKYMQYICRHFVQRQMLLVKESIMTHDSASTVKKLQNYKGNLS